MNTLNTFRCILALGLLPGMTLAGCASVGPTPHAMLADSGAAPASPGAQRQPVAATPVDVDSIYKILVAEFAGRRGMLSLALDNYLHVARQTGDAAVAERAVRIAVYARDQARGLEAARLWVESSQGSEDARQVLGALLVRAGQTEEAITVLRELVQQKAEHDPEVFARVGKMLVRERSQTASVRVMEAMVADFPHSAEAQFALAQVLRRFGELDRALQALDRVRSADPADERAAVFTAQVLQQQGKKAAAISTLETFLAEHEAANTARLTYARLLVDGKRYDDARTQFKQLSEAAPENADVAYALGLLSLQTSDLDQAEAQFRRLVELRERRETAWFYLGQIAESREDTKAALEAYRHVDGGEHHVNAQIRAAVLMAEAGDVAAARQHLHALRGRNRQESVRIYRADAELLIERELLADAMAVYDASLEEFPKDGGLLYARSMLAVKLDRIDVAERDLRDILSREPDNADALNALGYTLADRTERYQEAYELIKRAYELKPDDHYIVDSMGWVLYRLGRLDEAVKHLRRALELKSDPEVAMHLGEVLWVMGDKDGAKDVWNTALKAQPEDKRLLEVIKRFGL